jgi:hypothetical protein
MGIGDERLDRQRPDLSGDHLARVLEEVERAIRSVAYGSVEVIIQNSRVVQIERKEKFRFSGES